MNKSSPNPTPSIRGLFNVKEKGNPMITRIFETTEGHSVSIDVMEDGKCSHDEVEYLKIESLGGPPVWLCSKCGKKLNEKEFLELQQKLPN
ncbi:MULTISPECIES: hypothetical protein [Acinetobacter calcoaceticus/baumannii complex]|nr:hypothetical protein [Acinetobacter pittii]